jgi:hypothetical protein
MNLPNEPMDDGTGKMVPTEVFWGSRPNSEGVSAADDWAWDFAPKGEWMEIGVGESSNVSRVWVKPNSDNSYFGNEAMEQLHRKRPLRCQMKIGDE